MEMDQLNNKIDDLEKRIKIERVNMEEYISKFLEAAKEFSIEWIGKMVNDRVKTEPHVTLNMDKSKLKELKSEYQKLVDKIPSIVEEEFGQGTWKHVLLSDDPINGEDLKPYSVMIADFEINIDKHLGRICGHAGELLIKYGYYKKHAYKRPWKERSEGGLKYSLAIEWSPQMRYYIKDYMDVFNDFYNSIMELKSLRTKKAELEAERLWDSL